MRLLLLSALVVPLLAGCSRDPVDNSPANPQISAEEANRRALQEAQAAQARAEQLAVNAQSPAPDRSAAIPPEPRRALPPGATPAPPLPPISLSPVAEDATVYPPAMQGSWALVRRDCDTRFGESRITIEPARIKMYEAVIHPLAFALAGPNQLVTDSKVDAEGETVERRESLTLVPITRELWWDHGGRRFVYRRCS